MNGNIGNVGKFITIEGPDFSGKSTQGPLLAQHLRDRGYDVIVMREPGGSVASEMMRKIVLENKLDIIAEMLIFAAQRAENVAKIIKPALEAGQIVISDRFHDSTYAYQGFGRQKMHDVMQLEAFTLRGFEPDYTLFFDVPFEECQRRREERRSTDRQAEDHFEQEERRFKDRVYKGYQQRFKANPHRMYRIDALPEVPFVTEQVIAWVNAHFDNLL